MRHIPLAMPSFGTEEIERAIGVLQSGYITMGRLCTEFEAEFARFQSRRHAILVNSGSSANLLAFFLLANPLLPEGTGKPRLKPGSEVIVPALSWSTTVWPILQAGAVPVFVDSDPRTLQVKVEAVEAAITDKTVAICAVHVLGNAAEGWKLRELAEARKLWLIEDSCEAVGTSHQGRLTGSFGEVATFSFYYAHHLTTIEGGMVVTDDDELADLLRAMRAHGWVRHMHSRDTYVAQNPDIDPRYLFICPGFNVRSTEINAAIGLEQLKKLERMNHRRNEIVERWIADFAPLAASGRLQPMVLTAGTKPAWFGFPALCATQAERDRLRAHLEGRGVETRPIICGNITRQPAMKSLPHRVAGSLAGADQVMDCGIYWGTNPEMTDDDIAYVSAAVREAFA